MISRSFWNRSGKILKVPTVHLTVASEFPSFTPSVLLDRTKDAPSFDKATVSTKQLTLFNSSISV